MTPERSLELERVMGDAAFAGAMRRFADAFPSYRERLPRIARAYSRTRLAATSGYEIVAMVWAPQSVSPVHDHGDSRCWVLMLDGLLDVQNYLCDDPGADPARVRKTQRQLLRRDDVDHRLSRDELHRVTNPHASHYAWSLQLYAAPLSAFSVVDLTTGRRRDVTAVCDLDLTAAYCN